MHRYIAPLLCIAICAIGTVQADMVQFSPGLDQVPSVRVTDMACGKEGECYFATDNGLSIFNGNWRTLHPNLSSRREGILSDRVLALERDAEGTLWIGYSTGLQWYNNSGFFTLQDQQLLKNLMIQDLLRQEDAMWVASGDAGLHRYRNGTWTWFKPHGESGLSCNHVYRMAIDRETGALYLAAGDEGIFMLENESDPIHFQALANDRSVPGIQEVRSDPLGGILFFNRTHVYQLRTGHPPRLELQVGSLLPRTEEILDVARTAAGELLLATDTGIFLVEDGRAQFHIGRADGLWGGKVRRLFLDGEGRCWFSTSESVGYIHDWSSRSRTIPVQPPLTAAGEAATSTASLPVLELPAPGEDPGQNTAPVPDPLSSFLAGVEGCIAAIRAWAGNLLKASC